MISPPSNYRVSPQRLLPPSLTGLSQIADGVNYLESWMKIRCYETQQPADDPTLTGG